MAQIELNKQKIEAMSGGEFQALCDAYLAVEKYDNLIALGRKTGTNKTAPGTPDTYIPPSNRKYIFVECTAQK